MQRRPLVQMNLIATIVACASTFLAAAEPPRVVPGRTWDTKSPAEAAMDAGRLKAFSLAVGGRGCVVRGGYLVHTWGDNERRGDVASAAKPLYSHFLFAAIEAGKIESVDESIAKWAPRLNEINAKFDHKDAAITWRDLACQTSCYGVEEKPGEAFDYSDYNMALLFDLLFTKVHAGDREAVDERALRPLLADAIQCEDRPTFLAFGLKDRPGRIAVSPRDFCRFGLLYLREGEWNGKRLISRAHVRQAIGSAVPNSVPRTKGEAAEMLPNQRSIGGGSNQSDHLGSYSFAWWTNGVDRDGKRHWPDVPADAYGAFGHWGVRALVVIPSLDIVVSWNDARVNSREQENEVLANLVAAVREKTSLEDERKTDFDPGATPKNDRVVIDPANPRWLFRKDGRPFFMCGPGDPEDFLYRGRRNADGTRDGDQLAIIRKLAGTGANCLYVQAIRSHGGDGDRTHNPFIDNDPAKGLADKVLDQWAEWFAEADRHGIVMMLFLYDDSARVWNTGDEVGDAERAYVRALVKKFGHLDHLVWCIAEEYQERLSAKRVSNLAAEIRAAGDKDHAIAVHKLPGVEFREFADDPHVGQFAMQLEANSPEELHRLVLRAWKNAEGKYSLNMAECVTGHGRKPRDVLRRMNWASAMAGAYVMVYQMDGASTPVEQLEDCGRLVRFFEQTDFHRMSPRDDLAAGDAAWALANPTPQGADAEEHKASYIVYAANPKERIGIKGLPFANYELLWLDCRTGKTVRAGAARPGRDGTFELPEGLTGDVALYIRLLDFGVI
ncbi:MAG: DUF4038 domain-containing protein [Planctomycetales bacterium]